MCEAINSTRRTGVQREKDLSLQPLDWTEDDGLVTPSSRPALLAESYVESAEAAIPSWATWGERIILAVKPVRQGSRTQVSMAGNLGQKPNSATIITEGGAQKEGLQDAFRNLPPNRSQKLTTNAPDARPGYLHPSPKVQNRPTFRRSSRLASALRVPESAECRHLVCAPRSNPRSGYVSGGSVMP